MYRKIYKRIVPQHVVEFLILNAEFPRAIHFCVIKTEHSLHQISGTPQGRYTNFAEQSLGRLRSDLDYNSVKDIVKYGLHEYLDKFQMSLNEIGDLIRQTFVELAYD